MQVGGGMQGTVLAAVAANEAGDLRGDDEYDSDEDYFRVSSYLY